MKVVRLEKVPKVLLNGSINDERVIVIIKAFVIVCVSTEYIYEQRRLWRIMKAKALNEEASRIGQDYFYGGTKKKNYKKAFPYLLEAAMSGDIHCQNLVGYCFSSGFGVKKDINAALSWYQRAAKHHHEVALYSLARFYERGEGVKKDIKKAFSLYKKAAELGDEWAQCNLAVMYLEGVGTKQDIASGIGWMRKAARQGDAKAQYNLGKAYLDGEGVRRNKHHARIWLEKAVEQGYRKAILIMERKLSNNI